MAKSQRVILFVSSDAAKAKAAETAFATAASRLGLRWSVRSITDPVPREAFQGVAVVVLVDGSAARPGFTASVPIDEQMVQFEVIESADLDSEVNKLLARLLGGNDNAVAPPPSPPPVPPKKVHTVKVSRETAGRKGKGVTVVSDLPLNEEQLKELATKLKNACGTGGTAKDGRIEIQGEHRDKLMAELEKLGYKVKRAGG